MYYPGYHSASGGRWNELSSPGGAAGLMEGGSETVTITEFLAMVRVTRPPLTLVWPEPRTIREAGLIHIK